MGIVRLPGRNVMRLLTTPCERTGQLTWAEALAGGESSVVGPAACVDTGVHADTSHSGPDQTSICRDPTQGETERRRTS
jgi:hypothetical protein